MHEGGVGGVGEVGDSVHNDLEGGETDSPPIDIWTGSSSESGSVLSFLRNSVRRLGLKFGYIKKAEPHPDVLHDFQDEDVDLYHEYQCMTADDKPILINNVPVTVHRPEDCQQFFAQSKTEGYASVMEPPLEFVLAAKTVYKSNEDWRVPTALLTLFELSYFLRTLWTKVSQIIPDIRTELCCWES